jgi:hypothetical protein
MLILITENRNISNETSMAKFDTQADDYERVTYDSFKNKQL